MSGAKTFIPQSIPKGKDYIHYFYRNYDNNDSFLPNFLNDRKSILSEQIKTFNSRKSEYNQLAETEEFGELMDEILQGNAIQQILENSEIDEVEVKEIGSIEEAENKINQIDGLVQQMQAIKEKIENILNESLSQDKINAYSRAIVNEYIATEGSGMNYTQAAQKIITDLLERNNESFFKLKGSAGASEKYLSNTIRKLLAEIGALDIAIGNNNAVPTSSTIKHGSTISGTANTQNEVLAELSAKTGGYLRNVNGAALEIALAKAFEDATGKMLDENSKLKASVSHSGSKRVSVKALFSPELDSLDSRIKNNRSSANKISKSDVGISVSDGSVTAQIGFSVKNYTSLSLTGSGQTERVSLKLQDGTPLYTLMKRELGMDYNQIIGVLNILSSHPDSGGTSVNQLNKIWENLKDTMQYKALLAALAGLTKEESAMYLVVNNKIFDIGKILEVISAGLNDTTVMDKVTMSSNNAGFSRSTYMSSNTWEGNSKIANYPSAISRSYHALNFGLQELYNTKIKIELNISTLRLLMAQI